MQTPKAFTLVEIMIVVAIIGILIAIAVPSFLRAREVTRRNACQENQSKIDGAKVQWALEFNRAEDDVPGWDVLIGSTGYLRKTPACPSNGEYAINSVSSNPSCTKSTNALFPHSFVSGDS